MSPSPAIISRARHGCAWVAGSAWLRVAVMAFVVGNILARWDPVTGFTALPRFGEKFAARQLPALRALPVAPSPGDGYDGQFYAQIAVEPNATDPDLVNALDKPSYRPRRIVLPWLAHVVGGGEPWRVLQVYALLNVVAWLALALVWWRLLPPTDWRSTAGWLAGVLAVGALDSVRMALTDLPAALLLVLAALAIERGRAVAGAAWCLLAGGVREVSLIGALVVRSRGETPRDRWRTFWLRAACTGPVLLWVGWLAWRLPGPVGHEGNIEWPGWALARQAWENIASIAERGPNAQRVFGLLGGAGLAVQAGFVLSRWRDFGRDPWLRIGLPFAVLFWLIGADPWIDYRAVARDCLPLTLVFSVLWVRGRLHPAWLLTHVSAVDGVWRML